MRYLFSIGLILMIGNISYAEGPLFKHSDPKVDQEFRQAYNDIRHLIASYPGGVGVLTSTQAWSGINTFGGSTSIKGTTAANNALPGYIGEQIESIAGVTNVTSSATWMDLTSITLSAGDWDIAGMNSFSANGGTWSAAVIGISTTAGNDATGLVLGTNQLQHNFASSGTSITRLSFSIPAYRISCATPTTVYLKHFVSYTVGTPTVTGRITARRVR